MWAGPIRGKREGARLREGEGGMPHGWHGVIKREESKKQKGLAREAVQIDAGSLRMSMGL